MTVVAKALQWSNALTNIRRTAQHRSLDFVGKNRARVAYRWHELVEHAHARLYVGELQRAAELLERNLTIVDVGCRWGIARAWEALGSRATIVGFDPDAAECARLRTAYRGPCDVRFVAAALGDSIGTASLYVTQDPSCSSLLEPDPVLVASVPQLACVRPVRQTRVELTTLDQCAASANIDHVDFLKLDTQGTELMVLRGASASLASTRAVEVEVEFNPIYVGQPLFGDVDSFLRAKGFVLWRLKHLAHYSVQQRPTGCGVPDRQVFDSRLVHFRAREGQLFWCNAYYVRSELASVCDLTSPRDGFQPPAQNADWQGHLRDACILRILGFHDLARFAFKQAVRHGPPAMAPQLERLVGR